MFRRMVNFVIGKEDTIKVVDTLSRYGAIRIVTMEEGKHYQLVLCCAAEELQHCLDNILKLSKSGVSIKRMNIKYIV